jgi:hypothetical protein
MQILKELQMKQKQEEEEEGRRRRRADGHFNKWRAAQIVKKRK